MLLAAEKISKSYLEKPLFNNLSLYLNEGDKIGLIGVNGTGKTTLLNILAEVESPDSGSLNKSPTLRIEYLEQNPQLEDQLTLLEQIFKGTSRETKDLKIYEAKTILSKLGMENYEALIGSLSGGQRKRVAIARALVHPCEILILDEPTNHLDNEMVTWLEGYLSKYTGAILMVTHDRYFLDRVTNKILELNQGELYSYPGNYTLYLEMKAEREENEQGTIRKKQSYLRKELAWIQQGPRGRGTKSKERIANVEELREKCTKGPVSKLEIQSLSTRLGTKIIELHGVSKHYGDKLLFSKLDQSIQKRARIGIIGKNGCGKSTLLNILSGKVLPDQGTVSLGSTVKIGYFSQNSEALDLGQRVIDSIRSIAEIIKTPEGTVTASQMLERFLFPPSLQWNTINKLSGGEQRRLFLLRILMGSPNVLLLDEPTNDLDIETLTILEEYLEHFRGVVVVVSHDRYFLDKVTDSLWAFEDNGEVRTYQGPYTDYLLRKEQEPSKEVEEKNKSHSPPRVKNNTKLKLSFHEQRELAVIDSEIELLEEQVKACANQLVHEASDYVKLQKTIDIKHRLEETLEKKMERWVYLNDLVAQIAEQKDQ